MNVDNKDWNWLDVKKIVTLLASIGDQNVNFPFFADGFNSMKKYLRSNNFIFTLEWSIWMIYYLIVIHLKFKV
jgi:hypothetical protein